MRLDHNLNVVDYIKASTDGRLCLMQNDDAMIYRDYGNSELCQDFGKGKHQIFSCWDTLKTNPNDISSFCKLNDTTFLLSSLNQRMYIYKQKDSIFKRFNKLGKVNLPTLNDRYAENTIVTVDKSNILYKGIYINDSLSMFKWHDLRTYGVIECYFLCSENQQVVIATNKGLFIIDKNNIHLIDKSMGLPDHLLLKTAAIHHNIVYVATSEGIYRINVTKLRNLRLDYTFSNLTATADTVRLNFSTGQQLNFNKPPHEINLQWELNAHPYPENLRYEYAIGNTQQWMSINTAGKIRIVDPAYGTTSVYLQITDETNGKIIRLKLADIYINEPIYMQAWFWTILSIVITGSVFFVFYRRRIKRLSKQALEAETEAHELQLRLDMLQFLLKPHFIFNALSSVQNLMMKNEIDKSLQYTGYFAKFLRGIMQNSGEQLIPLKDELDNTMRYIELEKLRFNENVEVKLLIDETVDITQILIIPFLFQPLVENIFKHAFNKETPNPEIKINIQCNSNQVVYSISDNGKGLNGQSLQDLLNKPSSKGMKIMVAQLQKFFPHKHQIYLGKNPIMGTCWTISIPN